MDLPLAFQKTKLTEKGVFVKRGIKKTAQEWGDIWQHVKCANRKMSWS
jgi:hypothetical protein